MPASSPRHPAPALLPASVLALVLLAGFAVTGWRMVEGVRMAPSTPVPAQALAESRQRAPGEARPIARPEAGPPWSQLTTPQKEALYPMANYWSTLSAAQKRHWLKLAEGFHAMAPHEQDKMLARLTDWASLSSQQRSQARLNYATTNALAPDSKRALWEAYQALSQEERQRLAAKAAKARPTGAATAVRPTPRKLVRVPAAVSAPAAVPNPPKIPRPSDAHVPQALPVPVPAPPPPPPPPVVVETRPVETPSVQSVTILPPLPAEDAAPEPPPPFQTDQGPLHPPQ